ncbi:MAG: UDP-N-acetylmuramate dehydrogenase [Tannerella sp.]|jgi:UDP-N-acetylmuramate dehydrogenase|nr:UDP-N-acetylmuramate dehydrogenase [Tannerella sp.]
MEFKQHYSLENLNTFQLPVIARWFVEYENEDALEVILNGSFFHEQRSLHIGRGSNMLFLNDFEGVILHSSMRTVVKVEETGNSVLLRIGAGKIWDDVVAVAADNGWWGIENLSLIPGETGAAAVQNIGAYGVEIKDVIETVVAYHKKTSEKRVFSNAECEYGYRRSVFKSDNYIITYVFIRLQKNPVYHLDYGNLREVLGSTEALTIKKVRDAVISIRRQKLPDPAKLPNAGSFFMNPIVTQDRFEQLHENYPDMPHFAVNNGNIKLSAGWLIEQCGLKGKRMGAVGTYEQNALVIVNHGGASGREIAKFASYIQQTVQQVFDIELTPEVKYV